MSCARWINNPLLIHQRHNTLLFVESIQVLRMTFAGKNSCLRIKAENIELLFVNKREFIIIVKFYINIVLYCIKIVNNKTECDIWPI